MCTTGEYTDEYGTYTLEDDISIYFHMTLEEAQQAGIISNLRPGPVRIIEYRKANFDINYSACIAKFTEFFGGTIPSEYQVPVESMCTTGEYDGYPLEKMITNQNDFNMTLEDAQTAGIISNLTYDTSMAPPIGTTYTDGQYTYKYMMEYQCSDSATCNWVDMLEDGWGVALTDVVENHGLSTVPVTSELCTSINGKYVTSMSGAFILSKTSSIDLSTFDSSHVNTMTDTFTGVSDRTYSVYARTVTDANKYCSSVGLTPNNISNQFNNNINPTLLYQPTPLAIPNISIYVGDTLICDKK